MGKSWGDDMREAHAIAAHDDEALETYETEQNLPDPDMNGSDMPIPMPERRVGVCNDCGHSGDWHRTADGSCTHQIEDEELGAWMRCGCKGWR